MPGIASYGAYVPQTRLPLSLIATPERVVEVADAAPGPEGIDWSQLTAEDLEAMPVLAELRG